MGRSPDVSQILAEYLGGIKSHSAHDLLWQGAERPEPAREQALIALHGSGRRKTFLGFLNYSLNLAMPTNMAATSQVCPTILFEPTATVPSRT